MRRPGLGSARALACAALLTAGGCGGGAVYRAPETAGPEEEGAPFTTGSESENVEAAVSELDALEAELRRALPETGAEQLTEEAMPAATTPDCDAAPGLRDRICELAERICALAARNPGDVALDQHCERASASCEEARSDVAEACGG